jgi:hypothetical protein
MGATKDVLPYVNASTMLAKVQELQFLSRLQHRKLIRIVKEIEDSKYLAMLLGTTTRLASEGRLRMVVTGRLVSAIILLHNDTVVRQVMRA